MTIPSEISPTGAIESRHSGQLFSKLQSAYCAVVQSFEKQADIWLIGFSARFVFASTLFLYYFNSALTKVGDGFAGFFAVQSSAYFQIVPQAVEAYGFNPAAVPFFPYGLIVYAGTYAEFILPLMIVLGLFTRLAALGMIGFIIVQSIVDYLFHGVGSDALGAMFDRAPDAVILDQRLLWIFLLLILVLKGAGMLSVDRLLIKSKS
jgi:putative oxidoreductase